MITVGTDTFISLEDADTYFSVHLESSLWGSYSTEKKEASLRGSFFRIESACTYDFESDDAPEIVKIAQCEWALELSKQQQKSTKSTRILKSMEAGPVKMEYDEPCRQDGFGGVTDWIKQMLSKECQCSFNESSPESQGGYVIRYY